MSNTKDLNYKVYLQTKDQQPITLTGIPQDIFDISTTSITLGGTKYNDKKLEFNYTTITENIEIETDISTGKIDLSHGEYFIHDIIDDISSQFFHIDPSSSISVTEDGKKIEFNDISNNVNFNVITQNEIDYNNFILSTHEEKKKTITYKKQSRNNEKAYSVFLKPTKRDITLFGIPNTIFAVPRKNSIIQIKKNEQLFFRYLATEGILDIVPTGEYNNISRIDEGDYFIQDFNRILEKSFNTNLKYTGKGIEFNTINKNTLVSFHTQDNDIVTPTIFNTEQLELNSISKLMPIDNYNSFENEILTPKYLDEVTDIYVRANKICFDTNARFSKFNFYTVTDKNNGRYTITTQAGYSFAFNNYHVRNIFYYNAGEYSTQTVKIINGIEYIFISGTINIFVRGDFGSIDIFSNRIGSNVINTETNGITFSSITNFLNNNIQGSVIQETNQFEYNDLINDISSSLLTTILTDYDDQGYLYNFHLNNYTLEIENGTNNIGPSVFYNKNIKTINIPESVIEIDTSFPNNPVENILITTNTTKLTNIFNDQISNDISFAIFDISNNIYYKSSQTRSEIINDMSVNLIGSTLAQYSLLEKFGIQKAKLIDIGYTDVSLGLIGINDISYTLINKDISYTNVTRIIKENEFNNLDISSIRFDLSINHIQTSAFENNKIKTIDLSGSEIVDISTNAFRNNLLTSIDLTNCVNLSTIGNSSFYNNNLTILDLTTCINLTRIENYTFYKNSIHTLLLPSSINYIGKYAFAYNDLSNITLTNNIITIEEGAFAFNNLDTINLTNATGLQNINKYTFMSNNIIDLAFPYTIKNIYEHAFSDNDISSISFNSSLKTINYGSFQQNKLTNINLINTVLEFVGGYSFYKNPYEKTLTLPSYSGFQEIKQSAFEDNKITNKITIPSNVISIEKASFKNNLISELDISNASGLELIEEEVFEENDLSGTSVSIPSNIIQIKKDAFKNSKLSYVNFSQASKIILIGNGSFNYNNLQSVKLTAFTLRAISSFAFANNNIHTFDFTLVNTTRLKTNSSAYLNNPITTMLFPFIWRDLLYSIGFGLDIIQEKLMYKYDELLFAGFPENDIDNTIDSINDIWLFNLNNGNLVINDNTKEIKNDVFKDLDISSVIFDASMQILGDNCFKNCNIQAINLPEELVTIGKNCFENNQATSINIKDCTKLTLIESEAFKNNNFEILDLSGASSNLISINNEAFADNTHLKTVNLFDISSNVKIDGENVFKNTPNFNNIILPPNVNLTNEGIGFSIEFSQRQLRIPIADLLLYQYPLNAIDTIIDNSGELWLYNYDNSNNYNVIEGVIEVRNQVFKDISINKLVLPSSLHTIGQSSFENSNIQILDISNATNLTVINENAFNNNNFENIYFPKNNNIKFIYSGAFANNTNLKFVDFGDISNNTQIQGENVFNNTPNFNNALLPKNINLSEQGIGFSLQFSQQQLLISINDLLDYQYSDDLIDKTIDSSGDIWLYDYKKFNTTQELTPIDGVIKINSNAFENIKVKKLEINNTITEIANDAFNNSQVELLDISNATSLTTIGNNAFNYALLNNLDFRTCGSNLLILGNYAFANNSNLQSIDFSTITENLNLNSDLLFLNTPMLTSVIFPSPINGIYLNLPNIGFTVFFVQQKLKMSVSDLLSYYFSSDTIDTEISSLEETWLYNITQDGVLEIIRGVTAIGNNVFKDLTNITSINIPSLSSVPPEEPTLVSIGNSALENCNISNLSLPNTVTTIGNKAFKNNIINSLTFTNGIVSLGDEAFSDNEFEKLDFTNIITLRTIGSLCFANNSNLKEILFTNTDRNLRLGTTVFLNCNNITTLVTPYYWNPLNNGLTDTDLDKIPDILDVLPEDPTEISDRDGDLIGDYKDSFPDDPRETQDIDRDNVGDNADVFPEDPTESKDSNNDGIGDNITNHILDVSQNQLSILQNKQEELNRNKKYRKIGLPDIKTKQYTNVTNIIPINDNEILVNPIIPRIEGSEEEQQELIACIAKLNKLDLNHHHSYETYLIDKNKNYEQREFNFKSINRNNSQVLLNDPVKTCYSTYKPNNKQYGNVGSVNASDKTARTKYNTLNYSNYSKLENNMNVNKIDSNITKCFYVKDKEKCINNEIVKIIVEEEIEEQIIQRTAFACLRSISKVNIVSTNEGNKYVFNNINGLNEPKYDQSLNYIFGLSQGRYIFTNISQSHPMALLNKGINSVIYYGDENKKLSKTINNTVNDGTYDFYYGDITVDISGIFDKLSIYCYYHGYMGGENILQYADYCTAQPIPIIEPEPEQEPEVEREVFGCLHVNSVLNIVSTINGNKYVLNNINGINEPIYDASLNYVFGLSVGKYTILNVPREYPIAILNNNNENITYSGDRLKKYTRLLVNTTNDGYYDFYYGNITINVIGDFNEVSIHSYYNDYMGGENMLRYASYCTNDIDVKIQEEEKIEEIEVIERQEEQRAIISFPPLGLYPPEFKILS